MRMTLVCIQVRCEQPEGPEGNVSRYTVRPGTPGSTLVYISIVKDTFFFKIISTVSYHSIRKIRARFVLSIIPAKHIKLRTSLHPC
jgi:hypothetical protein